MPENPNGKSSEPPEDVEVFFMNHLARFDKAPPPRPPRPGVQLSLARFGIAGLRAGTDQAPPDPPEPVEE